MNRRQFIVLASASLVPTLVVSSVAKNYTTEFIRSLTEKGQSKTLFGVYDDESGQHFCSRLVLDDGIDEFLNIESMQIPFRAHATLPLSAFKSISFGRRPHNQMIVCDFKSKQQQIINAFEERHFYGHGCIHNERNTLFTTENDYENARGVIGIRDSDSFQQIDEYESYGIGPHDIHLMPDNKTLVVANGGIQSHPDFGRRKLNLDTMQPSLIFIDIESGKKIDEYRLDNPKMSIRHLTISADGGVGIAAQYQRSYQGLSNEAPDYLLAWLGDDGLKTLNQSQQFVRDCKDYIGDIVVDPSGQILLATSSRGNNITLWDIKQSRLIKTIQISGPSGLCFDKQNQEFLVSNDKGVIYKITLDLTEDITQLLATQILVSPLKIFPVKWDNHMMIHV